MAKVLHVISLLLLLAATGIGIVNRSKLVAAKGELDTAKGQAAAATQQASESARAEKAAKDELAAEQARRQAAEQELAPVKQQLNAAESKISSLKSELDAKAKELADLKAAGGAAGGGGEAVADPRVAEMEARVKELEGQLLAAEGEKKVLAEKADAAVAEASALREAEDKRAKAIMRKGLEGTILAYNPAWNFVVLNIGDRQGATAGAEMIVARGTRMIGRVKITSVEPSTSIADVVLSSVAAGTRVAPGDRVFVPAN